MRKAVFVLLAGVVSLVAADITGKWTGTFTPEGGSEGPALLVLQQKGEALTGTAGPSEEQRFDISNGKVVGDKVTFEAATMKFELTLTGEELAGQVNRERDGQRQTAKLNVKRTK